VKYIQKKALYKFSFFKKIEKMGFFLQLFEIHYLGNMKS